MAKHDGDVALQEKKPGTEVVTYDFGADAGKGMENMDASEYRVPFIRILDPKSPQCKPVQSGGLPGAKGGAVFNTATGELWDGEKGFTFIPCARDHKFVQFHHRDAGGGFVKAYPADDGYVLDLIKQQGRFKRLVADINKPLEGPNAADQISEVFELYGIMVPPDNSQQRVVIGFGGMQIKKYQSFMTRYMNLKYPVGDPPKLVMPPLWAHRWHYSTTYEERGDQSWYGWKIRLAERNSDGSEKEPRLSLMRLNDPLYQSGKEFNQLIAEGHAKADMSTAAPDRQPGEDEDEPPM